MDENMDENLEEIIGKKSKKKRTRIVRPIQLKQNPNGGNALGRYLGKATD